MTVKVNVFTGTKAQFVKMVPVLIELDRRRIAYRLIDTGQHAGLIDEIIGKYGIKQPDLMLSGSKGVYGILQGVSWLLSIVARHLVSRSRTRRDLFGNADGYALVHGDTASTLISALVAIRGGQRVVHVEAGLRSWNMLDPFPEEIIRVAVMRLSQVLFASSTSALRNLQAMGLGERAHLLPANTLFDTVRLDAGGHARSWEPNAGRPYAVVTLHRLELLYSRRRLRRAVRVIERACAVCRVVFVMHPPTRKRLEAGGLLDRLNSSRLEMVPLMDHGAFLELLMGAEFVITDGGSVQEETSYLGVPTLVLRKTSERSEGLGQNVVLSEWQDEKNEEFLRNYSRYRKPAQLNSVESPSTMIVDELERLLSLR